MWQLVLNNIENFENFENIKKNNVLSVYNGVGLQQYVKHITDQNSKVPIGPQTFPSIDT